MPNTIPDALRNLIGQNLTITVKGGGTFTGTLAHLTDQVATMAANNGVVYIRTGDVSAVSTPAYPNR